MDHLPPPSVRLRRTAGRRNTPRGGRSAAAGCSTVATRAGPGPGRRGDPRRPHRQRPSARGVAVADGRGGVLLPAFADVHAHLDSTRLGLAVPSAHRRAGAGRADRATIARTGARREVRSRSGRPARSPRRSPPVPPRFAATPRSTPTAVSSAWRGCWRHGRRTPGGPTCRWSRSRSRASCAIRAPRTCSMPPCGPAPTSSVVSIRAPSTVTPSATSTSCSASPSGTGSASTSTSTRSGELGAFTIELIAERTAALGMQGRGDDQPRVRARHRRRRAVRPH